MIAYSRALARQSEAGTLVPGVTDIVVFSCCPGELCSTDFRLVASPGVTKAPISIRAQTDQAVQLRNNRLLRGFVLFLGWCRTDMGGQQAPLSAEEGAQAVSSLALNYRRNMHGKFVDRYHVMELGNEA